MRLPIPPLPRRANGTQGTGKAGGSQMRSVRIRDGSSKGRKRRVHLAGSRRVTRHDDRSSLLWRAELTLYRQKVIGAGRELLSAPQRDRARSAPGGRAPSKGVTDLSFSKLSHSLQGYRLS